MQNNLDIFVSAIGTGGTISGIASILKQYNPSIKIIGIEPSASAVISGKKASAHKIQGIGAGFIPKNLDLSLVDEIITVDDNSAINTAKLLAKKEGILAGISSGANVFVSNKISQKYPNKKIVTILCDTAQRYLSTELF